MSCVLMGPSTFRTFRLGHGGHDINQHSLMAAFRLRPWFYRIMGYKYMPGMSAIPSRSCWTDVLSQATKGRTLKYTKKHLIEIWTDFSQCEKHLGQKAEMMPCFSFQNVNVMKGSLFEPFGSETVAPLWPRSLVRVYMQSKMGVLKLSRENGGLLPVWNWGGIFFWGRKL